MHVRLGLTDRQLAGDASRGEREQPAPGVGGTSDPNASPPSLGPSDNAVILVHAAGARAFRVCFDTRLDELPQPDDKLMPNANVVGVDVGTAVRLPPITPKPNRVFVFEERTIRERAQNTDCRELLESQAPNRPQPLASLVLETDLTKDVHLLVLSGCAANAALGPQRTKDDCGDDFDPVDTQKGNLKLQDIVLRGFFRRSESELPTQVVQLSYPLERARASSGAELRVGFGEVTDAGDDAPVTIATNPTLLSAAVPEEPVGVAFAPTEEAAYGTRGFTVTLDGQRILAQSLASVQALSSPTDLPQTYYAQASNYVLLLLGNPAANEASDALERLHFLAVPVVQPPPADGGSDVDAGP